MNEQGFVFFFCTTCTNTRWTRLQAARHLAGVSHVPLGGGHYLFSSHSFISLHSGLRRLESKRDLRVYMCVSFQLLDDFP